MTTAYLITSTITTPDLRQARRPLRPQEAVPVRDHAVHHRLGRVLVRRLDVHARRACAPSRGSAPAGCSRSSSRSSATSSRRGSARSTPATSCRSSPPRACSARSPAACSPARRRSSASPAGAGSSWSTCRSASRRCSWSTANLHLHHVRREARIDWWGAICPRRRPGAAAHGGRAGPHLGLGLPALARLLRHRRRRGARVRARRAPDGRRRPDPAADLPAAHRRRRDRRRASSWVPPCSGRSRSCRSTCRSCTAPRRPRPG